MTSAQWEDLQTEKMREQEEFEREQIKVLASYICAFCMILYYEWDDCDESGAPSKYGINYR